MPFKHNNKTAKIRSYETKQLGCFRRASTSLHSNFTHTRLSPINHSWRQKTTDTGLPFGKGGIRLRSRLTVDTLPGCGRQTDARICRSIYSAAKL